MSDPFRAAASAIAQPPPVRDPTPLAHADELCAYRTMLLIRRFEEKAGQLFGMGYIGGYCHLCIGQEAVATGLHLAAQPGDQTIASYRSHGHMLAAGISPRAIMAELLGRGAGVSKGKGGSMHMFSRHAEYYGGHGFTGANVPLGAGIALASRYRGDDKVCWCHFGDGASQQGQVHETLSMAASWRLPIVFVIESSTYALGADDEREAARRDLSQLGRAFSIPGWQVDGTDVRAVFDAGARAAQWVRGGHGPFILEVLTPPFRGHAMSDPVKCSAKDAASLAQASCDPIAQSQLRLVSAGIGDNELREIDKQVRALVNDAVTFAKAQPEPDAVALCHDVTVGDVTVVATGGAG